MIIQEFFKDHYEQFLQTVIVLIALFLLRLLLTKTIKKIGKLGDINKARTRLIIKYFDIALFFISIIAGSVIWSVDFKDLTLLLSSIFAVLGVAMFAQWSILSNITSGIILFFSFPFKIGDRICIQDKDFPNEAVIEDIKAFYLSLRLDSGELVTYPNNLILQKGVVVIDRQKVQ